MNPTPWKAVRHNPVNVTIEDANGVALATAHQFPLYCDSMETAQRIVEAVNERDRLRDLVRRLVADWEPFVSDGPLSYPDERQRAATMRNAEAALAKEAQP